MLRRTWKVFAKHGIECPVDEAVEAAMVEAEVHGDARGSAAYKRELIRVFMGRAIRQASGKIV